MKNDKKKSGRRRDFNCGVDPKSNTCKLCTIPQEHVALTHFNSHF